jgi:hypothetical protein
LAKIIPVVADQNYYTFVVVGEFEFEVVIAPILLTVHLGEVEVEVDVVCRPVLVVFETTLIVVIDEDAALSVVSVALVEFVVVVEAILKIVENVVEGQKLVLKVI